jgi:hypothetical protein
MVVYVGVGGYFRAMASGKNPSPAVDIYLTWTGWLQIPVIAVFLGFAALYFWRFRFRTASSVRRVRWYGMGASATAMVLCVVAMFNWGLLVVHNWLSEIGAVPSVFSWASVLWLAYFAVVIHALGAFMRFMGKFFRAMLGRVVA